VFTQRWKQLTERVDARLAEQARLLDVLDRRSERAETILMIREPASTVAADAYEGLRRQILAATSERLSHLSQLAQIDAALAHGADSAALRALVAGWFSDCGLTKVTDTRRQDVDLLFDVLGSGTDENLVAVEPAYVDTLSGRVIRRGRARRVTETPIDEPTPQSSTDDASEEIR
jgi:hypothetical protein